MYKLHGVLVHSGDLHGGHYFALIKPDRETRWLKYDDDRVTPVTDREVLEENYGGEPSSPNGMLSPPQRNQVRSMKRFTNAYMLVYIRETAIDEVLAPFTDKDTPPHLSTSFFYRTHPGEVPDSNWVVLEARLESERLEAEQRKREREEQHLYLTAKAMNSSREPFFLLSMLIFWSQIITDESFQQHQGFDLASFDDKNWPPSELQNFRILKSESYLTFKSRVAQHFNYPESQIRLWVLVNRQNKTVRPDTHVPENESTLSMSRLDLAIFYWLTCYQAVEMVRNNMAARQTDLRLYLDVIPDPTKVLSF